MRQVYLLLLILLLAACDGRRVEREIGVIESNSISLGAEVVSAPDTVQAGVPFEVTVRTYGGGCIEPDGLEVSMEGNLAVLIPYDRYITPGRGTACPLIFEAEPHTTQLTFSDLGSSTIRVEGRREDYPVTGGSSGPAVVEKTIQVE